MNARYGPVTFAWPPENTLGKGSVGIAIKYMRPDGKERSISFTMPTEVPTQKDLADRLRMAAKMVKSDTAAQQRGNAP